MAYQVKVEGGDGVVHTFWVGPERIKVDQRDPFKKLSSAIITAEGKEAYYARQMLVTIDVPEGKRYDPLLVEALEGKVVMFDADDFDRFLRPAESFQPQLASTNRK